MKYHQLLSFFIILIAKTCYIWDAVQANNINDFQQYCRYVFYIEKLPWGAANEVCSMRNRTLAKIDAYSELSSLATMAISTVKPITDHRATVLSNDFWIGLHAYSSQGDFSHFWADCDGLNTAGGFNPWADVDQSTIVGCVAMNASDEKYRISNCDQAKQFICEDISTGDAFCWEEKPADVVETSWFYSTIQYPDQSPSDCATKCSSDCAGFYQETFCTPLFYSTPGNSLQLRHSFYQKNFISYSSFTTMSASVPPQVMCSDYFSQIPSSSMETSSLFDITSTFVEEDSSTPILSSIPESISTTAVSTQYFSSGGITTSQCYCPCAQYNNITYTPEELHKKLEEMRKELTINVKETNTYKRTLISAPDNRMSAKSIGYFGAVILALVGGTLLLMDIPTLVKDTKLFFTNLSSCCKM